MDFRVTPESLRTAAAALQAESRAIEASLAGLEREAGRLRSDWDGAAQNAYDTAHRRWSATFAEMKTLLSTIAAATGTMADEYVAHDKQASTLFTHKH